MTVFGFGRITFENERQSIYIKIFWQTENFSLRTKVQGPYDI